MVLRRRIKVGGLILLDFIIYKTTTVPVYNRDSVVFHQDRQWNKTESPEIVGKTPTIQNPDYSD
jgi:hypothetical protein